MPRPKMKGSGSSPAKSDPSQTPRGNVNLLRTALTRSASVRRTRGMNESKRKEGNTSALSDLSNLSNTSLNNTGARKIAALARFKEFELEVTPRQALREFNQAHSSVAMTPSLFMPRKSTRKRKADTAVAPVVVASEDPSVEDLVEDDVSSEASSTVETAVSRRKSARLSRTSGITMEDLDPDKDLTRPTSVPASLRPSEESLLLDDTNDATMMVLKRRRDKPKKKHFVPSDFDLSKSYSEMPQPTEKPEAEASLSQSVLSDDSRDASRMIDEKMKKRREMMEKKLLRKKKMLKTKSNWDFSGIEPPAPLPETETAQASLEEVPLVSQSDQDEGGQRTPRDFSNLLEIGDDEEDQEKEEEGEENEETLENIAKFVGNQREPDSVVEKNDGRRKSVYQAGLNTFQKSVVFDQSVFRPETESTRLAISSVSSVDFQSESPVGAKPGRDTSTPFITRRQQALSKSAVLNVIREDLGEQRANQTTDPRMPSPRVTNLPREAVKSGTSRQEDVIEGAATQTSPHLEADVGCQVTPGLADLTTTSARLVNISAGEKSQEPTRRQQMDDLTNSLAEEVNIDLPLEDEGEETEELQQNITNSGRKNPSPISERRNEVDEDEEDEEEVFVEPHQGTRTGDEEHLVSVGDVEQVQAGQAEGRSKGSMDFSNLLEIGDDDEEDGEDVEQVEDGGKLEDMEEVVEEGEQMEEVEEVASLSLPAATSSKAQPSGREVRELRQATLTRYLGIQDSASPLVSPLPSPEKDKVLEKPKPKPKPKKKEDPTLIFPPKQVKFEFQRFSRYKLKTEADSALMKASQSFLAESLRRMSKWAEERGADHIHLCDVKRMMEQCGFVPSQKEDPRQMIFHEAIRDIARREHVEELIPCNLGRGEIYPPKDCWEVKGGKKKKSRKAKADKVKRLKGRNLNETDE